MLVIGLEEKTADRDAQLVGMFCPVIGFVVVGGEAIKAEVCRQERRHIDAEHFLGGVIVILNRFVRDADLVIHAEVVGQSAAKDAVAAAALLRIKSSRLSAIERKVKIVAKVAAQVEAVDSVIGDPGESLETTELGIEPAGLLTIFHVAIKKFTGCLVVI